MGHWRPSAQAPFHHFDPRAGQQISMRQEAALRIDDLTPASAVPPSGVEVAALAPVSLAMVPDQDLPADPPLVTSQAVSELLALLRQDYALPPGGSPDGLGDGKADEQPHQVLALGPDTHDPASLQDSTHYSIEPLAAPQAPVLSLDDQDLFGQGQPVTPQAIDQGATGGLFHGFQVDLFGQQLQPGGTLEAGLDPSLPPLVEPTFSTGLVTMYDGRSFFELTPELAATLLDQNGNLKIVGDGDDVVALDSSWSAAAGDGGGGYGYYVNADAGITVAIKGADVIFV